jgi:signal transduction histidine kinase
VRRRVWLEDASATALATALSACLLLAPPLAQLGESVADAVLALAARWPPPLPAALPDAALVAIDSASLQAHPDWPWPRRRYAQLIERLDAAGARAIAFDIDFSAHRDPTDDALFAAALARYGRAVLGVHSQFEGLGPLGQLELTSLPTPALAAVAARLGTTSVPLDRDGTVRRARPGGRIGGQPLPSLALAALWVALSEPAASSPPSREVPIDYRRHRPPLPVVSFAAVLEGRVQPAELRDRVVFVGASAPILQDLWKTPIDVLLPGVLIHALEYRQHVAQRAGQRPLRRASAGLHLALAVALSLLARVLARAPERRRQLGLLTLAALCAPASALTLVHASLLFSPLAPVGALAVHYVLGLEWVRRRTRERLDQRERSMAALVGVGRLTADGLAESGARLALGMLGEAVDARGLWLLQVDARGELGGPGVRWLRSGHTREPGREFAGAALAERRARSVCEADTLFAYLPLLVAGQAVGVLVAGYPRGRPPPPEALETIATVGGQISLAIINAELVQHLRQEMERARAADRAKSEFLANMSHEIRTPMSAVLGYLELLDDPRTDAREHAALRDAARRNGEHMLRVINDILDLAQIEAGRLALARGAVDPAQVCRDVGAMFEPQARARGLELALELRELPSRVWTDGARLRQILVNLVGNALKFSERGRICVRAHADAERGALCFEVTDQGIGIDPAALARLFEPFVQADGSSTRRYGGTGLGLAIVRRLVTLLDGHIAVESQPGVGSAFRLEIPLEAAPAGAASAAHEPAADRPAAPVVRAAAVAAGRRRVLLAEDGADNQRILAHLLRRAGCEVALAQDGQEACAAALAAHEAGAPFELILMDIDMPVMDGYEATRHLRQAGCAAPIVALTAHALPQDRDLCLAAGCSDYASKPITRERLGTLLALHLASGKEED